MKNTKFLILLLAIIATVASCSKKTEKVSEYPMFWTWMNYRKAIPIARKHGIEVYAWLWTTNPEHDRDVIDRTL